MKGYFCGYIEGVDRYKIMAGCILVCANWLVY